MKSLICALTACIYLTREILASDGEPRKPRKPRNPSPLQINFVVEKKPVRPERAWAGLQYTKRGIVEPMTNFKDVMYLVDIQLGTPKQRVSVILDTGSSDLWVPHTSYFPWRSISSSATNESFHIEYIDGSVVNGMYYQDRIQFENQNFSLSNFQFARASTSGIGILGIANHDQVASKHQYNNFPWALKEAGIIPQASYSLYLGPLHGSGSIIFGGVDTDKFEGELVKYQVSKHYTGLSINLKAVRFHNMEFFVDTPAILDSGTSLGFLHRDLINELDGIFNTSVRIENDIEYRYTSCSQPADKYIEFDFGQNVIRLSYADAVVHRSKDECALGFAYRNDIQILGDVFLRNAYVYYDLSEDTISLAQVLHKSH